MAITVKSTPADYGDYPSAHNDLFFVVESDNLSEDNFKYVFDVYVDAVLVGRFKVFPEPEHSFGVFNAGPIIRSYLNNLYFTGETDLAKSINPDQLWSIGYVIKYGEEYGSPVTTYTNLVVSGTNGAFNYYNHLNPINTNHALAAYTNDFLSSFNSDEYEVSLYDNFFMFYFSQELTVDLVLKTYDSSGAELSSDTVELTQTFYQLSLGPVGINDHFGTAKINGDVSYYTVTIGSKTLTFTIDCWPKFITQTLVYLNELGGYETAHFRMKNRRKSSTERKVFGKNNYKLSGTDGLITYNQNGNVQRGNQQTYSVKQTNKYSLCTDLLTDDEFEHLANLFNSPQIYMEFKTVTKHGTGTSGTITTEGGVTIQSEAGLDLETEGSDSPVYYTQDSVTYIPVKILSDNYDFKTRAADKLNPLELEVELLQTYNSQYA